MIDAHHHFWRYDADQHGWIGDEMAVLRRDFLPADLEIALQSAGVSGVVSVQARQSLQETRWLLEMAQRNAWILGVVGWVPLIAPDVSSVLEALAAQPKLRAVRHVLHDEGDDDYMLRADFNRGIAALRSFDLAYDILIFERHLPQTMELVDRHPDQIFVVDHIAKPRIKSGTLEPWKTRIGELARRENVFCKVSGMVTEAPWTNWTPDALRPYFEVVLEAFGPEHLMFGSDWPVCLAACDYARWAQTVRDWAAPLAQGERDALFERTARRAYGI